MEYIKLRFTSPLHLSRGKLDLDATFEVLHSDTLKSALFVCALQLDDEALIPKGDDSKQFFEWFTISSAFPYIGDELFFPKPERLPESIVKKAECDKAQKDLKSLRYFTKRIFVDLMKGEIKELDKSILSKTTYYSFERQANKPFKSEVVQRVMVPRDGGETVTFYTDRLFFADGCGLFFLIDIHDGSKRELILAALALLGDNGIGSDKTVGNGQFKAAEPMFLQGFDLPKDAECQMSLSMYLPDNEDVERIDFLEKSAYNIALRGGYMASPENVNHGGLRKKSVRMFTEGSVFPMQTLVGKVADLKPRADVQHPVWRDGRAMFLPYKMG